MPESPARGALTEVAPNGFDISRARSLQDELLLKYQSEEFEQKCCSLNATLRHRHKAQLEIVNAIDELCETEVMCSIIVRYGFSSDREGCEKAKAAVSALAKQSKDVQAMQAQIRKTIVQLFPTFHGSTQDPLEVRSAIAQIRQMSGGYEDALFVEDLIEEERERRRHEEQEEERWLRGDLTDGMVAIWRCVFKPRMVIRSAPGMESAMHPDWKRGLLFEQEVEGRAVDGWVHLKGGGFGLIRHPEHGQLLQRKEAAVAHARRIDLRRARRAERWASLLRRRAEHLESCGITPAVSSTAAVGGDTGGAGGRDDPEEDEDSLALMARRVQELEGKVKTLVGHERAEQLLAPCGLRRLMARQQARAAGPNDIRSGLGGQAQGEVRQLTPVAFWGICDIKFDPGLPRQERVRVLELGDGRASRFSNHGSTIKDRFTNDYYMAGKTLKRAVLVENKKLTHDMFVQAGFAHLRPLTFAYPRRFTQDLPKQIISDLKLGNDGAAVLKLCNRSRGAGIVVVTARNIGGVLLSLLTPPTGAALQEWLELRAPTAAPNNARLTMLEEQCLHWWSNECPVFVAERCCHSIPVALESDPAQKFDGTMRVAFALSHKRRAAGVSLQDHDDRPLELDWLGGYWKLPRVASSEPGHSDNLDELHDSIVSSFNAVEKRTAEVEVSHLRQVYEALAPALPLVFQRSKLTEESIVDIYRDDPLFCAFVLSRAAASERVHGMVKANALLGKAQRLPARPFCKGVKDLPERSVLSYIERNIGVGCAMSGNWDEAAAHWKRAVEICPVNSTAYYLAGCRHQLHGEYDQGITCSQMAIALDPDFRSSYMGLSNGNLLRGHYELAIEACEACLRRFPDAPHAQFNIGQAIYQIFCRDSVVEGAPEMSERALQALEIAKRRVPEHWSKEDDCMLQFFLADELTRTELPRQPVHIWSLYGWRP